MWLARDAEGDFNEQDHPRAPDGKFGNKGGSAKSKPDKGKVASKEKQSEGIDGLGNFLKTVAGFQEKSMPAGMSSPPGFILKNGYPYTVNEKTYEGKRAPMHECYKNATLDVLNHPDRDYVEGYVSVHGVPIEHAWTVDKTGQVYDSTVRPGQEIDGYYGVPFSSEYVLQASLKNKVYGLLGMESRKTLMPLLKGETKDFKAKQDVDALSAEVISDRLAHANRVMRAVPATDKIDTPERHALRKKIQDNLYNKDIENRKHDRDATIVLGLPASGKSYNLADPIVKEKGALEVDPDLAKSQLPEYNNGLGASAVHEESSMITRDVMAQALSNGDNIVWPRVDSPEKVVQDLKNLKKLGYKVHIKMMDVDPAEAQKSAIKRFIETNRYLDPNLISEVGTKSMESYEAALKSGLADSTELFRRTGNKVEKVDK